MLPTDRFVVQEPQLHGFLQPECPVYVHCTRQSEDPRSGAKFLQLRLVNRSERVVETVVFDLEGINAIGESCCILRGLVMAKCGALPKKIFGEDRVFTLQHQKLYTLRVTVQQVTFADGMLWRKLPQHTMTTVQEARWNICQCAMPNPPEKEYCELCGSRLFPEEEQKTAEIFPDIQIPETLRRPAPVLRREIPAQIIPPEEDEEEGGVPAWLSVLLCIFGTLAILAVLAFAAFFLWQYIM